MMSRLVSFLTPVVVLSFVAGCGGSSSSVDSSGTARATLTFTWPQRSRLIPIASNSIKISISNGTTTFEKLVTRPDAVNSTTTQITFDKVNSGNYQVTATAYPNADGTGRPQALGTTSLSISQGQTTNFNITMDSTVTQVKIVGPLSLVANVPTTFTAQAIDSANYLVLVDPSTLQWTAGTNLSLTGGPTVFSDSVTVTGTAVGADDLILTYVEPTVGRPTVTRNLTISGQIGVVLAPATQTILPGDSLVLQATVVNGSNPNVTWNVTGASTTTSSGTSITITAPNGQQSLLDITSNPYIQISGNTLTVLHSNFYQTSGPYQFSIPSGIIHGVSGGNFVGVSDYSVNLTGLSS